MQLEAGKKYTDRRGRVYGPMLKVGSLFFGEDTGTPLWNNNGKIDTVNRDMDLVAEYVEPVKSAEPAPVESPDDLVIQDRVPARNGVDRGWFAPCVTEAPSHPWLFQSGVIAESRKHGDKMAWGDTLNVYCKRKDLPPVPPQKPKTRTVVLKEWLCWDDDCPVVLLWQDVDPATDGIEYNNFQHAVETGNARTVEIPVT